VWNLYYEQLQAHGAAVAALTGQAPPADPFAEMERRLAGQQALQATPAGAAAAEAATAAEPQMAASSRKAEQQQQAPQQAAARQQQQQQQELADDSWQEQLAARGTPG
jgi:hypothetical protein